jgi:hypothetical protein
VHIGLSQSVGYQSLRNPSPVRLITSGQCNAMQYNAMSCNVQNRQHSKVAPPGHRPSSWRQTLAEHFWRDGRPITSNAMILSWPFPVLSCCLYESTLYIQHRRSMTVICNWRDRDLTFNLANEARGTPPFNTIFDTWNLLER